MKNKQLDQKILVKQKFKYLKNFKDLLCSTTKAVRSNQ